MTEIQSNIVDDQSEPDFEKYKVVILGDGAVGKTSLAMRLIEDQFGKQYKQTIGVDFFSKRISGLPGNLDVCLQVWDIGGQSIGAKMISNYIYGADALVFVYDVTNYQSFQNLDDWVELAKNLPPDDSGGPPVREPIKILIANKMDLEHLRTVKKDRHDVFVELISSSSSFKPSDVNAHPLGAAPPSGALTHGHTAGSTTTSTTTGSSTGNTPHSTIPPCAPSSSSGLSPLGNPVSFFVSAKTGAQVQAAFRAIAAELAGVCLTSADSAGVMETPMSAHIMDYPRNDPAFKDVNMDDLRGGAKSCVAQ